MDVNINTNNQHGGISFYVSVFLISLSVLMLEIGLARIFSVMFDFSYEFLVVSTAILGLGSGGIYLHYRTKNFTLPTASRVRTFLPFASALMAMSVLVMTMVVIKISFFQHILLVIPLAFLPFFFGGMFLSTAFHLFPEKSSTVYAADLIGAALGSWLLVALLKLGGINVILLVAIIASLPASVFLVNDRTKSQRIISFGVTAGLLALFLLNYSTAFLGRIPSARGAQKEMASLLAHPLREGRVIESRWSAFGRTDLITDAASPDEMVMFIDGTAGTAMYRFDGDIDSLNRPELTNFPGYFPFTLIPEQEKEKVLIIGAGGGREVLLSLLGGAKEITAVEVNQDLVDLMTSYADFNGGIYDDFPGVNVEVEEGRQFIRATQEQYDLIMLSLPITKTSRSPEGFALTENFLFTEESINDYLDRLTPNGRLIVVAHHDIEIFRLVFTSLAALNQRGISVTSAMNHLYTVGPEMFPVFVLKKSPLTPQEAQQVHEGMHEQSYSTHASFIPFVEQEKYLLSLSGGEYQERYMLNQALYALSRGEIIPDELLGLSNFDIRPATDNSPFFYKFTLGLPPTITILLVISALLMVRIWFLRAGSSTEGQFPRYNFRFLLLFSALGIGFMLIEIPLIQKFILFLGQPVYAVAALLFSLLLGAGIGSWISGRFWKQNTLSKLRIATVIVGGIVLFYLFFLDHLFADLLGSSFSTRLLISLVLLLPLGGVLGMPFPLGMTLLDERNLNHDIPKMWGVNGVGSVFGSTLSIALAISFGFSYALSLGALLYFVVFSLTFMGGEL